MPPKERERFLREVSSFSMLMLHRLNNSHNREKPHYLDVPDSELMAHLLDEVRELQESTDSTNKMHELVDIACMAMLCYWSEYHNEEIPYL